MMNIYLHGIAIANYRGIGATMQRAAPLSHINLFIGANNSGKSAFLAFVAEQLPQAGQPAGAQVSQLDLHLGATPGSFGFQVAVRWESFVAAFLRTRESGGFGSDVPREVESAKAYITVDELIWVQYVSTGRTQGVISSLVDFGKLNSQRDAAIYTLYRLLHLGSSGGDLAHWLRGIVQFMNNTGLLVFPKPVLIPAVRQVGEALESSANLAGAGLIESLSVMQHPTFAQQAERQTFDDIVSFVRNVVDDESALLEIPHTRDNIHVKLHGRMLPLKSLGTGIHEIIMLAAFCTVSRDQIVCIEEPEIHLHPSLQRKLMRYLATKTSNQYLIATHSPVLIDTPGARVFHVAIQDGQTVVTLATSPSERYAVCADLGYRASDIVQANSIIWVEGPSDRIYLKHWIGACDSTLVEGLHYSIMFYGGRLLSHLSATDDEVTDFISLRALNQNLAVLMDSDKEDSGGAINETKARVIREFDSGSGIAWTTAGREIENYVPSKLIEDAVRQVYGERVIRMASTDNFAHALPFYREGRETTKEELFTSVDKVKIAKAVCEQTPLLECLDLRERIEELVAMIRTANF